MIRFAFEMPATAQKEPVESLSLWGVVRLCCRRPCRRPEVAVLVLVSVRDVVVVVVVAAAVRLTDEAN